MAPVDEPQVVGIAEEPIAITAEPIDVTVPPDDDDLEEGWRAAMPSGRFFSIAIASAGVGLIVAGLATKAESVLTAMPWH